MRFVIRDFDRAWFRTLGEIVVERRRGGSQLHDSHRARSDRRHMQWHGMRPQGLGAVRIERRVRLRLLFRGVFRGGTRLHAVGRDFATRGISADHMRRDSESSVATVLDIEGKCGHVRLRMLQRTLHRREYELHSHSRRGIEEHMLKSGKDELHQRILLHRRMGTVQCERRLRFRLLQRFPLGGGAEMRPPRRSWILSGNMHDRGIFRRSRARDYAISHPPVRRRRVPRGLVRVRAKLRLRQRMLQFGIFRRRIQMHSTRSYRV